MFDFCDEYTIEFGLAPLAHGGGGPISQRFHGGGPLRVRRQSLLVEQEQETTHSQLGWVANSSVSIIMLPFAVLSRSI